MKRIATTGALVFLLGLFVAVSSVWAQTYVVQSQNKPLSSLRDAIPLAPPHNFGSLFKMPNIFDEEEPNQVGQNLKSDPLLQPFSPLVASTLLTDFPGADNDDNAANGGRVAPPDTDGDVGPNHYVQMINSLTTIFDKNGTILSGPFTSNAFWVGQGDICEFNNNGDPIVIYDEDADRWLISQFALNSSSAPPWAQCVAISQTGDPLGAYNRYSFLFDTIGFNDYPKHGIVTGAITISARIFNGPLGSGFHGVFLGAMDKAAMYAGGAATMVGQIVADDGITASDYDNPGGAGATVAAFFGSALFSANNFTIWELTPNFPAGPATLTSQNVATTPFNSSVPNIPQPPPGPALDDLSGFTMHRLQIRDFGTHLSMVTNHTVNVGAGRAGVRWYEFRSTDGGTTWTLHQEGTYAPNDGENRWMGSIAMNANGDIGLGYLLASAATFGSIRVVGQTAAEGATASGIMDADELVCKAGTNIQAGVSRAGDYSAMNVDPTTGSFWYTQEYFNTRPAGQNFHWDTHICEFDLGGTPPIAFDIRTRRLFRSQSGIKKAVVRWDVADVSTNKIDFYYTQDPALPAPDGTPDKRTRNDSKVKLKILLPGDGPFNIQACEKNSTTVCSDVEQVDFTGVPIDLNEPDEDDPDDGANAREGAIFTAEAVALSNYPNPFNPTTLISYTLPDAETVTLRVFNVLGQEVQTLVNGYQEAGAHRAAFSGDQLSAGVYFYVLQAGAFTQTQRMTLIK